MSGFLPDPFEPGGIREFGARLRKGRITAEAATDAYLRRIAALEPHLQAFEHVAPELAIATARACDRLLAAGIDLGPLMGVPVAVKDLLAVEHMPTCVGSNLDVSHIVGGEGPLVTAMKRAGCIILGKTRLPEFALGGRLGYNFVRPTPRNPWDAVNQRVPGGSSSGSAVAVAAGLCAFAIGSDSGGSGRVPAALCGVYGLKPTRGTWSTAGMFPTAPTFDTISLMTRTAGDAALVFSALANRPPVECASLSGLRLGRPVPYLFEELDEEVQQYVELSIKLLEEAGAKIVPFELPEIAEHENYYPAFISTELLTILRREWFLANRDRIDPVVAERIAVGLDYPAERYIRLMWRRRELEALAGEKMRGLDGWLCPTTRIVAPKVEDVVHPVTGPPLGRRGSKNAEHVSVFGMCAGSIPLQALGSELPVGLMIVCASRQEDTLLSIGMAVEKLIGQAPRPELALLPRAG